MKYKNYTILMAWNIKQGYNGYNILSPLKGIIGWAMTTKDAKAFIDSIV